MKKWMIAAAMLVGCNEANEMKPLNLVPKVDIARYMGTWHVIANIPNYFEKDLVASTETYTPGDEPGKINVMFQGNLKTLDGKLKQIPQTAKVLDTNIANEWKVRIFFWLKVPYLIIDLDPEYQWTVVGYPDRSLVWIMARTTKMDDALYAQILDRLKGQGYDLTKIVKILQAQ